jgi:DNA-binding MarR family transcriptional regulator
MAKKGKEAKKEKSDKPDKPKEKYVPGALQPELTKAARSMRTFLTHSLSASGLYAGQDGVILALAKHGSLTAGAIAAALGVKPPTMTRTLTRMEAQGFIKRESDQSDGRQMRATLTDLGRQQVGAISFAVRATEGHALLGLSDKEIRQFCKLLKKINGNFGPEAVEDDSLSA